MLIVRTTPKAEEYGLAQLAVFRPGGHIAKPSCCLRAHTSPLMPHCCCTAAVVSGLTSVVGTLSLLRDHPRREAARRDAS